jgi:hypothetical protein
MPLILKISTEIGETLKNYIIKDSYEGVLNIVILNELLTYWDFSKEEISQINFGINKKYIPDISASYYISKDETITIHLIATSDTILQKLKLLFTKYNENKENKENNENNENKENTIYQKLSEENIDLINENSIKLLMDEDFKILMRIYIKRPELYNLLSHYIQEIDIIEIQHKKSLDDINLSDKIKYEKMSNIIKNVGLHDIATDQIIVTLAQYSGHLNLTLRDLLLKKIKNDF